jgi:uncharacterized protein (TIGR00251 family)
MAVSMKADRSTIITVKVIARASKCEVIPLEGGTFKVKLTRPALEGQANEQLREVMAQHFHTSKTQVRILSGAHSSLKRLIID